MKEFYLYGGIGMGVLGLMLIAYAVNHKMKKDGSLPATTSQASVATSVDTPFVAPNATPFNSTGEAASALRRAQDLIRMAQEESGTARNNHYKEAKHLCERILMTQSASSYHQKAGELRYTSSKMQTY